LEASVHDPSGTSSAEGGRNSISNLDAGNSTDQAVAISLQELSSRLGSHTHADEILFGQQDQRETDFPDSWNSQEWPFWENENLMPFAVGGLPFDFNMDFSTGDTG
jgi:hypothetical protein